MHFAPVYCSKYQFVQQDNSPIAKNPSMERGITNNYEPSVAACMSVW